MNLEKIKELEELCEKATPGPWTGSSNIPFYSILDKPSPSLSKHDTPYSRHWRIADVEFVVVARNSFPEALKDLKQAYKEIEVFRTALFKFSEVVDDALLLDEALAEAWDVLNKEVKKARKVLK